MKYPTKARVDGVEYPINTDFRVAIECNSIAQDESIGAYERALAVIYKLFGDKGLEAHEHHDKLLEIAQKYLLCGKEKQDIDESDVDMDFEQDMDYIKASFMSDYHMDLDIKELHWWEFFNLLNGLSNSELGNCCILNRIRNLRNADLSKIEDAKERAKMQKAKKAVALHKKEKPLTEKQKASIELFNKLAGIS